MVNTRVRDPKLRQINRKIDRQKKARMHLRETHMDDADDSTTHRLVESHSMKIAELKSQKSELKKETQNNAYGGVLSDLETLKIWAKELENETKKIPIGSMMPDKLYFQWSAINILILSQLEYLLKTFDKIKRQRDIKDIIQKSSVLNQLEKDYLIYLYLTRNTIVHNGGHFDITFFEEAKKHIKPLNLDKLKSGGNYLSPISPNLLGRYIDIVKQIIFEIQSN